MAECVNCKCALGVDAGELPFTTHDGETWCPQCLSSKRVHMEPDRYYPPGYMAVRCGRCKLVTVAIGSTNCGQCGWRGTVALPAKTVIAA